MISGNIRKPFLKKFSDRGCKAVIFVEFVPLFPLLGYQRAGYFPERGAAVAPVPGSAGRRIP